MIGGILIGSTLLFCMITKYKRFEFYNDFIHQSSMFDYKKRICFTLLGTEKFKDSFTGELFDVFVIQVKQPSMPQTRALFRRKSELIGLWKTLNHIGTLNSFQCRVNQQTPSKLSDFEKLLCVF